MPPEEQDPIEVFPGSGSWHRIDSLPDWPPPPYDRGSWHRVTSLPAWPPPPYDRGSWHRIDSLFEWGGPPPPPPPPVLGDGWRFGPHWG